MTAWNVQQVWHASFRGYLPDGYRVLEHKLRKSVPWCPTLVTLFEHEIKRVNYPIRPPPYSPNRSPDPNDEKKYNPLRQQGGDGVIIHLTHTLPWDAPKYGWYDAVTRAVIEAINNSSAPASRSHDFYLYEEFLIHENFEIDEPLRWKPIYRKGAWQQLNELEELKTCTTR